MSFDIDRSETFIEYVTEIVQNGFCHENGTTCTLGMPTLMAIVPTINRLRTLCPEQQIPVYFTTAGFKLDYSDSGILLDNWPQVKQMGGWIRGTWDMQIVDQLTPNPDNKDEIVIEKNRNSAFWGTNFEVMLAERGINHLILTGVATNICVESTARDAFSNGIYVTTVSDGTASPDEECHKASLKTLDLFFGGTATAAEVEEALRALE